ncbi:hypothetical protein ACFY4C_15650 [Actinomadura viridis]|uniref:hypothetical protein n=1 Tax=Actinomadura viridis TaxID=58110 RepID=UPI00369E9B93
MSLRVLPALLLTVLLTVTMAACEDEKATVEPVSPSSAPAKRTLDWNLSKGHTTKDVRWPNKLSAFELHGGVQVRLALPAGASFDGRVEKVMGRREGEVVRNLDLFYRAATTEDAYERAKRLGKEWSIDLRNIDAWYKRRMEQRREGKEDFSDVAFTGVSHSKPLGGPGGPAPAIEILNSFGDERPAVVNLSFVWPRQG